MISAVTPETVLAYWFGEIRETPEYFESRLRCWFIEAAARDGEIRERFAPTVEAALGGELDHWADTRRGRLALIVLLDQMTRQVFRGTARAFAGDTRARELCLAALDAGDDRELGFAESVMLLMPLVHAEDLALQDRSIREHVARIERGGPRALAPYREMGLEQAQKHRDWLVRFGRFPNRNKALGRESTAEELAFLEEFHLYAPPARYRGQLRRA